MVKKMLLLSLFFMFVGISALGACRFKGELVDDIMSEHSAFIRVAKKYIPIKKSDSDIKLPKLLLPVSAALTTGCYRRPRSCSISPRPSSGGDSAMSVETSKGTPELILNLLSAGQGGS